MKNLLTLHNDSSFVVQFSNSILLFTIKIIEMFELHTSMPGMQSAEYQMTIPLKFLIILSTHMQLCECLDNQQIKITTQFTGRDVTGQH